jgi:hypothetical protein
MEEALSTSCPSLEGVKISFDHFRQRRGKTSRIPDNLWNLLRPLKSKYKRHEICQVFSISNYQFNKYILQKPTSLSSKIKSPLSPFIEIPFSSVEKSSSSSAESFEKSNTLKIIQQDGTQFILTTSGAISDFSSAIELFLRQ